MSKLLSMERKSGRHATSRQKVRRVNVEKTAQYRPKNPRQVRFDADGAEDAGNKRPTSDDDDDDDDEEERLLSERHGEAEEEGKRSRDPTDDEIAKEHAAAKKAKTSRPRPTVQPEQLIGPKGLILVQGTFGASMDRIAPADPNDKRSAARYSRQLVGLYQSFCRDLCPGLAFEDVLLKIEQLGSKRQVKEYLQHHLRAGARNMHVERLVGLERGESLIRQLVESNDINYHDDPFLVEPVAAIAQAESPAAEENLQGGFLSSTQS